MRHNSKRKSYGKKAIHGIAVVAIAIVLLFTLFPSSYIAAESDGATETDVPAPGSAPEEALPDAEAEAEQDVPIVPLAVGDIIANLTWLNAPAGQSQNMTWSDAANSRQTQMPTYSLNLQANNNSYGTGQMTVRIPLSMWRDRNGNPVNPSQIGIPQAPAQGSPDIPFNYTIDPVTNELVITNTAPIEGGSNFTMQVQYNIDPWNTVDGSTGNFVAKVIGTDSQGNQDTAETPPISYKVDTGVTPSPVTKTDPQPMRYWDPALTGGQPEPPDFASYRWVSWRVGMGGTSNQPYKVTLDDVSTPNGQVYAISGEPGNAYNSLNPADFTVGTDGRSITSKDFTNADERGPANGTDRYLRVLVRYPLDGGNQMHNTVKETVTPLDGIDPPQESTAEEDTTWTEYTFDYGGARSAIKKFSGDLEGDQRDLPSKLLLLRRGVDLTVNWSVRSTVDLYQGVNYPANTTYSGQTVDDFINWKMVDSSTNTSSDPWVRMTTADYEYTSATLTAAAYSIERSSGRRLYYTRGQNGPLILIWAMVNGNWQQIGGRYAGELAFDNGNGTPTFTGAAFDLPAGTTQVRATYENASDHLEVQMDLSARIKATSPLLRAWLAITPGDGAHRLRLQNFCYYHVYDNNGQPVTQPPTAYTFQTHQGENLLLQARDLADYGGLLNRYTSQVLVWDATGASEAQKLASPPVNDSASRRVNVQMWLTGTESYPGLTDAEYAQLIAAGWRPPSRDEAVFYDLLPLGMFYNSQLPQAVYDLRGNTGTATMRFATIEDYKNTGRQMVVITVAAQNPGQNYTPDSNTTIPARNADGSIAMRTYDYYPRGVTGYSVQFGASIPWDNVPYARFSGNLAAYQVPEERPLAGGGYADTGEVFPHNGVLGPDGRSVFYDLRGNGVTTLRDTQYMSTLINITVPVSVASGITKHVRTDSAGTLGSFVDSTSARTGESYTYQLRVNSAENSQMRNVVLFDILDGAANTGGHSGETSWKGTFSDVSLDFAVQSGIAPVVYYSTTPGLSYTGLTAASLSDASVWSSTQPADKTAITALAIDLRKAADGKDYVFEGQAGTQVLIQMTAPERVPDAQYAYNQAAYYSTMTAGMGEPTSSLITSSRTTIGIYGDPIIEKSSNPEGGSDADSAAAVEAGQIITYRIKYNPGVQSAANIQVSDVLPEFVTFVPGSITFTPAGQNTPQSQDDSHYNADTRTIIWDAYSQSVYGPAVFSFQARVDALPARLDYRLYENAASAQGNGPELTSNTVTHRQSARYALITKTAALIDGVKPGDANAATGGTPRTENPGAGDAPVRAGLDSIIEYRLRVTNIGDVRLSGILDVSDAIPAGTTYVPGSARVIFSGGLTPSQATSSIDDSGAAIRWTLNQMSHREVALLTFRAATPATLFVPGDTRSDAELSIENVAQMIDRDVRDSISETPTTYHRLSETKLTVKKNWLADSGEDVPQPSQILVQLMANATAVGQPVAVRADEDWSYTWASLPVWDENGRTIRYTAVEVGNTGEYQVEYSDDTMTITNHYSPGRTSRTIVKSWEDADDKDGIRPASIQVQLYADGAPYGPPIALTPDIDWRYQWQNLPVITPSGAAITYTMNEISAVAGYETSYDSELFIITNTHTPLVPPPVPPPASSSTPVADPPRETPAPPQTGDSSRMGFFTGIASLSGLFAAVALSRRKRRRSGLRGRM